MYNDFEDREDNIYGATPMPDIGETENITQEELHAEEFNAAESVEEKEAVMSGLEMSDESTENIPDSQVNAFSAEQEVNTFSSEPESEAFSPDPIVEDIPQEPSSSFYHYSYERGEQQTNDTNPSPYTESPEKTKKTMNKTLKKFVVCAGLAVVFGLVGGTVFQLTNYVGSKVGGKETEAKIESAGTVNNTTEETEIEKGDLVPVSSSGNNITAVSKSVMPSIVAITSVGVQEVQSMFYGTTREEYESSGSGIIVDQNDTELLIATNNHVVEGSETLSVCFTVELENPEDAVVEAQVKGTDSEHDLAVIAVKLSDIPSEIKSQIKVAEMGDSDKLEVGEQAVAIGNALGYGQSVTVGYISALDREVTVENITNNLIQTDAAINPGNSGGALLNIKGEVIGINSVKAAATGVEGMGYAIPINTAKPILDDLMNRTTRTKVETAEMGYLGVSVADVSEEASQVYNMPAGAFIKSVESGTAAEKAGIKQGDIITKLDGVTITSRTELLNRMQYYKAGETIEVVVQNSQNGEYSEKALTVTLDKRPADLSATTGESETQGQQSEGYQDPYGGYEQNPYSGNGQDPFSQFFGE